MSTTVKEFKDKYKVTFKISVEAAQGANEINLLCDHNSWDPVAMTKNKNGTFSVTADINKDENLKKTYQYRYQYIMPDNSEKYDNDWEAELYIPNPFNGDNSAFTIPEPSAELTTESKAKPAAETKTKAAKPRAVKPAAKAAKTTKTAAAKKK